uniref:transmembrane 4 L6 family member 5-like isoform X1 n=2 Tax=Myxine glutinosa TaxID=7769 RepID=UPI00358DF007
MLKKPRCPSQAVVTMCTGKCAKCIGVSLIPLAILSIIANILLFFPNGQVWSPDQLSDKVWYFEGIVGAGLLMFIPSCFIKSAGKDGCCGNRCGMLCSILFSGIGFVGALYCFAISITGMVEGPKCNNSIDNKWTYPFFLNSTRNITDVYLFHQDWWSICFEPPNVVLWNIVLFSMLIIFGGIEMILCAIQIINGLFGTLCGTCMSDDGVV